MLYNGPVIDGHLHVESWFDKDGKDFYAGFDDIQNRSTINKSIIL